MKTKTQLLQLAAQQLRDAASVIDALPEVDERLLYETEPAEDSPTYAEWSARYDEMVQIQRVHSEGRTAVACLACSALALIGKRV